MVLYEIAPRHKCYYDLTFRDIPEEYILGGACIACGHTGVVNRYAVEGFWSRDSLLRHVDDRLRCLACRNGDHNTFVVFGRQLRKLKEKPLPATVEFGEPPPPSSLASLFGSVGKLYPPVQRQDDREPERDGKAHDDAAEALRITARAVNDNVDGEEISDRNQ